MMESATKVKPEALSAAFPGSGLIWQHPVMHCACYVPWRFSSCRRQRRTCSKRRLVEAFPENTAKGSSSKNACFAYTTAPTPLSYTAPSTPQHLQSSRTPGRLHRACAPQQRHCTSTPQHLRHGTYTAPQPQHLEHGQIRVPC